MRYKPGDKVRLNDVGVAHMPTPVTRAEAERILGVLTVDDMVDAPVTEDIEAQSLSFKETLYSTGSWGVEPV